MKVYIDDTRDPQKYLTSEKAEGIVWLKEAWEARNFLIEHQAEIEVLHLDNWLGDDYITGKDLFFMIAGECMWGGREEFANVKQIYLHSSDTDVVDELIEQYAEELLKVGVELINNHNESNY